MTGPGPAAEEVLGFIRSEVTAIDPEAVVASIVPDAELAALDLESVTLLSLVAGLEEQYGMRVPEAALAELRTVGDLVALARRRAGEVGLAGTR